MIEDVGATDLNFRVRHVSAVADDVKRRRFCRRENDADEDEGDYDDDQDDDRCEDLPTRLIS